MSVRLKRPIAGKKKEASLNAIAQTFQFLKRATETVKQYEDDEDSDESVMIYEDDWGVDDVYGNNTASTGKMSAPKPVLSEDDVSLFLDALQYNVLLDMGFKVFTS